MTEVESLLLELKELQKEDTEGPLINNRFRLYNKILEFLLSERIKNEESKTDFLSQQRR